MDTLEFFRFYNFANPNKNALYLNKKHLRIIQNAIYNIFFNSSIFVDAYLIKYFKRHNKTLKILASKQIEDNVKREVIAKNKSLIKKVGQMIIKYLE
jgi:hypothetical protein